jgi:short-subunit dehydrogenase
MVKTIVITGASSGFGKGVARKLGAQGHNVVLAARRGHLLDELVAEIGPNAIAVPTDVGNADEIRHLAERAIMDYGGIDVWINNAGVGAIGPFEDIPLEDQIAVVQTNFIGELNGSYVALRQFLDQGAGILINVASVAGKVAMPYYAVYGATKSAVLSMGSAIRRELELGGHKNIHICAVNPWATDTPFFEHASNYSGHSLRMPAIDDPEIVVDAIVDLVDNPKDEVDVSIKTKGSVIGSHLTPGFTESASARMTHKYLMEDAPADAPTSGSVHEPMSTGTGVEGHARERIARENEQKSS